MLAQFKNILRIAEIQKTFYLANVSQNQNHIIFSSLYKFFTKFLTEQQNKVILNSHLFHLLNTNNWTKKLKYYIIIHFLICQFEFSELLESFADYSKNLLWKNDSATNQIQDWINKEVIEAYHNYLLKFCANFCLYTICKKNNTLKNQDFCTLDIISKGFAALNMVRFIRQIQIKFNKLGRYYPEYKIIIDLFQMYLNDVKVYYNFVKSIIISIMDNYMKLNQQVLNHGYSLLNEFIEINDKLHTLFINRYYYPNMKNYKFPQFYVLDNDKYNKLKKHITKMFQNIKIDSLKKLKLEKRKIIHKMSEDDINLCRYLQKVCQSTDETECFSPERQKNTKFMFVSNQF